MPATTVPSALSLSSFMSARATRSDTPSKHPERPSADFKTFSLARPLNSWAPQQQENNNNKRRRVLLVEKCLVVSDRGRPAYASAVKKHPPFYFPNPHTAHLPSPIL